MPTDRILLARIGAPHGVRGEVRLFVFAEDAGALRSYSPLTDETGRRSFRITALRPAKEHFVARIEGVATREAAEALTNAGLYVAREQLPPTQDEDDFYHADLIGLAARTPEGAPFGTVVAVHDFGAGDILEIALETAPIADEAGARTGAKTGRRTLMLPFTRAAVPVVDIKGGTVTVDPAEWAAEDEPPSDAASS